MLEHINMEVIRLNKKMIIGLIALLGVIVFYLMMVQVNAQGFPCPISGRVITYPAGGAIGWTVQLYDSSNMFLKSYTINEYSEYAIDIGDIRACKDGDTFKLKIIECEAESFCTKTVSFSGGGIVADFDLTTVEIPPECPPDKICPPLENQTDTTPYEKCDSCCPTTVSCIDQGYILPANCPVKDCPEPTKPEYDWFAFITGGGLITFLYYLVKTYLPYKGKMKIERRMDRYGKNYIVVMKWSPYTKKDGTPGYKWILVQTIK